MSELPTPIKIAIVLALYLIFNRILNYLFKSSDESDDATIEQNQRIIKKILFFIFKLSPKLAFHIEYKLALASVKHAPFSIFQYPAIAFLTFSKERIKDNFLNKGQSVLYQVNKFGRINSIAFKRRLKRLEEGISPELEARYTRFRDHITHQKEIDNFIEKYAPEYKPKFNPDSDKSN